MVYTRFYILMMYELKKLTAYLSLIELLQEQIFEVYIGTQINKATRLTPSYITLPKQDNFPPH